MSPDSSSLWPFTHLAAFSSMQEILLTGTAARCKWLQPSSCLGGFICFLCCWPYSRHQGLSGAEAAALAFRNLNPNFQLGVQEQQKPAASNLIKHLSVEWTPVAQQRCKMNVYVRDWTAAPICCRQAREEQLGSWARTSATGRAGKGLLLASMAMNGLPVVSTALQYSAPRSSKCSCKYEWRLQTPLVYLCFADG